IALRLRPQRPLVGTFAAWSLSALPAIALVPPLQTVLIAAAYGIYQAGIAFGNNMFETTLQRQVPPGLLSRVDSFTWLVALTLLPVGQALAGPLSNAVGTDTVLVGAAALVVLSCAAGIATPSVRAITCPTPAVVAATRDPSVRYQSRTLAQPPRMSLDWRRLSRFERSREPCARIASFTSPSSRCVTAMGAR